MRRAHYKIKYTFFLVLTCYMSSAIALHYVMASTKIVESIVTALISTDLILLLPSVSFFVVQNLKYGSSDAPEKIKNYINETLGEYAPKKVTIANLRGPCAAVSADTIAINPSRLATTEEESVKYLKKMNFALFHEAGHLHNYHIQKANLFVLLSPLMIYYAGCLINAACNKPNITFSKPVLLFFLHFFALIPQIIANKLYEQSADEFACQNVKNKEDLNNAIVFFDDFQNGFNDAKKNGNYLHSITGYLNSIMNFLSHPSPKSRIAMCQKYINEWDKNHPVQ